LLKEIQKEVRMGLTEEQKKEIEIDIRKKDFRQWRDYYLRKYDILRINILHNDINPKTNEPYEPLSDVEKTWRVSVLEFTDLINEDTSPDDYPEIPERIKAL
jgi:hypothetical protein